MVDCSFCKKEITKDRYNFSLEVERQDIPLESDWQKSYDWTREDVCSKCFTKINNYFQYILYNIRQNKGEYIPNTTNKD